MCPGKLQPAVVAVVAEQHCSALEVAVAPVAVLDGDEMPQLSQAGEWLHGHGAARAGAQSRAPGVFWASLHNFIKYLNIQGWFSPVAEEKEQNWKF